jgi:uncharacterized integral membrane protein (TIGR00697 family)
MIWLSKPRPAHPAILEGRRCGGMPAGPWRLAGVADDSFLFFFCSCPARQRSNSPSLIDLPMRAGLWRGVRPAGRPSIRNLDKTDHRMTRKLVPGILAMAIIVVASNILVQHLFGQWLTWGAFTYPFAFLVTDLTNRFYGAPAARRVVWAGFATGVVCSLVGTQITGEFGPLVTLRVALASGTAFLVAQMLDVTVFDRMRTGAWWKAPLVSTLLGSSLDTALFFTIAFSATLSFIEPANDVSWAGQQLPLLGVGPAAPLWVSLAAADWLVKLALALAALVPFRLILARSSAKVAQKLLTNTKSVPPSLHRQHFERR